KKNKSIHFRRIGLFEYYKATISPSVKQAKLYKKWLAFASLFCIVESGGEGDSRGSLRPFDKRLFAPNT
ncbi:TPA: hypothetical protein ACGU7I_002630, partial [Enterococcus faecium]